MTDNELLELLRNDDPEGLRAIFFSLHVPLCRLAYRIINDRDVAKDIVQEVYVKLWQMRHELMIRGSLSAYMRKSVVNTALNYLAHEKRQRGLQARITSRLIANPTAEQISYKELEEKARRAIESLPSRTRVVFTLIRSEEMTYKEVAESLQISTKAVEKEMMKALARLRQALRDYLPAVLMIGYIKGF